MPVGYPAGQSYASHAFRHSGPRWPHVCWYCGLGKSDPNHREYRDAAT